MKPTMTKTQILAANYVTIALAAREHSYDCIDCARVLGLCAAAASMVSAAKHAWVVAEANEAVRS